MKQTTQTTINKDGIMQENITKQEAEALYQKKTDALQLTDQIPLVDGTPSAGTSAMAAHGDHVHPVPAEIPKNLYNLGAFDTYVSNGDGTGVINRRTHVEVGINKNEIFQNGAGEDLYFIYYNHFPFGRFCDFSASNNVKSNVSANANIGTAYSVIYFSVGTTNIEEAKEIISNSILELKLLPSYQYTEKVIENQPIRPANQEEELYWHDEWEKGLNLSKTNRAVTGNNILIENAAVAAYTLIITNSGDGADTGRYDLIYSGGTISTKTFGDIVTFTTTSVGNISIYCNAAMGTPFVMLVRGTHPYPYEPYNGGIIHEADLTPVKIADSATATSGTLTEEQLAILQNTDRSILFNNELYVPADREHAAGYLVYTHLGYESEKFFTKAITITIATRGWVLTSSEVGGGGGSELWEYIFSGDFNVTPWNTTTSSKATLLFRLLSKTQIGINNINSIYKVYNVLREKNYQDNIYLAPNTRARELPCDAYINGKHCISMVASNLYDKKIFFRPEDAYAYPTSSSGYQWYTDYKNCYGVSDIFDTIKQVSNVQVLETKLL